MGNSTLRLDRHKMYLWENLANSLYGVILYGCVLIRFFLIRCIPCIISQHGSRKLPELTKILSTTLSHFCFLPSCTFTLNCYNLFSSLSLILTHSLFVSFRPCSAASIFLLQHCCFNMSRCRFTIHSTISSIRFIIEQFPRKNV